MNDDPNALSGLVDIEPPVTPLLYVLESSALNIAFYTLLITGLFLVIIIILWKRYFSIKGKARRKIKKLYKKFSVQKINHHDVACQLSKLLRVHLALGQSLKRADFPKELAAHKTRWETFTEQLASACYSSLAPEKAQESEKISLLFADAYFWLKEWPSRKHV